MALFMYEADMSYYDIFELRMGDMGCFIAKGWWNEPDKITTRSTLPAP